MTEVTASLDLRRARRWLKISGGVGQPDTSLSHSSQFEVK